MIHLKLTMRIRTEFLLLIVVFLGCGQSALPPEAYVSEGRLPRFDDFPVRPTFSGRPLPVNLLSHPRALRFRDRLISGAKIGPNFAGHYTVVRLDCGTDCQQPVILDARTGGVVMAPFSTQVGFRIHLNSRLIIANPPEDLDRIRYPQRKFEFETGYYLWRGDRFLKLASVQY